MVCVPTGGIFCFNRRKDGEMMTITDFEVQSNSLADAVEALVEVNHIAKMWMKQRP